MFHYPFQDDNGFHVSVGHHKSESRSLHNRMGHYRSESGSGPFGMGDAHSSRSKNQVGRMGEGYRTGGRNGGDGMKESYDSTSDVSHNRDSGNDGHDISDTKNVFHGVIEALKKFQKTAHENEGGNDSREKDEVKGFRDEYESGSRNVAKGIKNFDINRSYYKIC